MYSSYGCDENYGKFLKLTKSRILLKSSETEFTVCSFIDNKRLNLCYDDMEILQNKIIEYIRHTTDDCSICDAVLAKYIVKYCAEKKFYIFANKSDFTFAMGLTRDTIEKIVQYYLTL
jgi:hypothetical protein